MTVKQIESLRSQLFDYLSEFADCFVSCDTRFHLCDYVRGQLSNLPRKSVEPIAQLMDVPPRTLQEFLSQSDWDHDRLRDRVQQMVARDHGENQALGIIDESGHPKKGTKTACVQRQYCGATGKIDNCVMSVHLCYAGFDGRFRAMLDSDLYVPKEGWDAARREEAGIPDEVVYRGKHEIALEQLRHALDNGMRFGWIVADEWYGEKSLFIEGLEEMGRRFVVGIPRNLMGWTRPPANADVPRGEVQNLVRRGNPMVRQEWTEYHVKDTNKGAMVWEAKLSPFWMKRDDRVVGPYWLVATRDRLDQENIKYFLSNASAGVPAEVILHVGFSRWPVERCLEDEKSELGLSHFEVRKYCAVLRHLRLTQVSHLFLARQTKRLAEKKSTGNDLPSARRDAGAAGRVAAQRGGSNAPAEQSGADHSADTKTERGRASFARQGPPQTFAAEWDSIREVAMLHPGGERIAL
jgi:SRSO17 transposase